MLPWPASKPGQLALPFLDKLTIAKNEINSTGKISTFLGVSHSFQNFPLFSYENKMGKMGNLPLKNVHGSYADLDEFKHQDFHPHGCV